MAPALAVGGLLFFANPSHAQSERVEIKNGVDFVQKTGMTKNLQQLAMNVIAKTTTMKTIINKCGVERATQMLKANLFKSMDQHRQTWDTNMGAVYAEHFSVQEMNCLYTQREKCTSAIGRFRSSQNTISAEIGEKNKDVLTSVVQDTLMPMLTEASRQCQ